MPAGRIRSLDESKQREVCALLSAGCSLEAAASYVECAPNTIRREALRNPDFGRRLREVRIQAQLTPLQAMRKAASNHWRAAAWMLERADPEHFSQRPQTGFRPKQAQTLRQDILAILSTEIEDPGLLRRVHGQIQHLMEYSIDGVVRVKRTDRQLRAVMREIDKLELDAEYHDPAAHAPAAPARAAHAQADRDPFIEPPMPTPTPAHSATRPKPPLGPTSAADLASSSAGSMPPKMGPTTGTGAGTPSSGPAGGPQLDPALAAVPVTWGDLTRVFQRLQAAPRSAEAPSTPPTPTPTPTPSAPAADAATSTPSIQHPASSIQHPASSIQHPASSIQHPEPSILNPEP
jgi:hypothetical protein